MKNREFRKSGCLLITLYGEWRLPCRRCGFTKIAKKVDWVLRWLGYCLRDSNQEKVQLVFRTFLEDLHDAYLLHDMTRQERICQAIEEGERLCLWRLWCGWHDSWLLLWRSLNNLCWVLSLSPNAALMARP